LYCSIFFSYHESGHEVECDSELTSYIGQHVARRRRHTGNSMSGGRFEPMTPVHDLDLAASLNKIFLCLSN